MSMQIVVALVILFYIALALERIAKALNSICQELATARWERGKRRSDM